jgi:carbonic anhydrase
MNTITKEMQESITPLMALEILKKGNSRFINNLKANCNLLQQEMIQPKDNIHLQLC